MATSVPPPADPPTKATPFGQPMRALFPFAPSYRNLNHGSYGTFPAAVAAARARHLAEHEARAEIAARRQQGAALARARAALLPLLGPDVHADEVVLVPNATTGVTTVLHNLAAGWSAPAPASGTTEDYGAGSSASSGDAVLYLATTYPACEKALQALAHAGRLRPVRVPVVFPADDDDAVVQKLRDAAAAAAAAGLVVRAALFDTVVSAPAVHLPWERLVAVCRDELGILSLVDAAHAVGQLDLAHLGRVRPDFFVSNCHKWLFVPRACALLYVPRARQPLLATSLPTSHGYREPAARPPADGQGCCPGYFASLFAATGTLDYTPWYCVPDALRFRADVCGGEAAVRAYCCALARDGAALVARRLGTRVLDNGARPCAMANVLLPFDVVAEDTPGTDPAAVPLARYDTDFHEWFADAAAAAYDTYFRVIVHDGQPWVRLSAQVYLDLDDFSWAADALADLCARVRRGEWRQKIVA